MGCDSKLWQKCMRESMGVTSEARQCITMCFGEATFGQTCRRRRRDSYLPIKRNRLDHCHCTSNTSPALGFLVLSLLMLRGLSDHPLHGNALQEVESGDFLFYEVPKGQSNVDQDLIERLESPVNDLIALLEAHNLSLGSLLALIISQLCKICT
ncbi:hypothetical protein NE237_014323 [Protea cynaroides]|uniref:Uncharacterized protein n=1 Tax=Protea cynaroides TaxID=273540 RepID=A0A9Q0KBW2_9MAGN|nr:hypothetical protein NE237_014323 [Protea cynaroides]